MFDHGATLGQRRFEILVRLLEEESTGNTVITNGIQSELAARSGERVLDLVQSFDPSRRSSPTVWRLLSFARESLTMSTSIHSVRSDSWVSISL